MLSKKLPGDSSELFPLWSESGDWPLASCVSVAAGLGFRLLWLLATAASLPAFLVAVAGAGCSLGASFLSAFVAGPGLGFSGFPELAALASGLFPLRTLPLESILGVLWAASGCAELSQLFSLAWLLQEAEEPPELKAWEQLFWDACHTGSVLPGHDTAAPFPVLPESIHTALSAQVLHKSRAEAAHSHSQDSAPLVWDQFILFFNLVQ